MIYETLKQARELISDESKWTKTHLARSQSGEPVKPNDPRAVCWCALGAMDKVLGRTTPLNMVDYFYDLMGGYSVGHFNDTHTHEEVLEAFDKAIEAAKNEGV